MEIKVKAKYIRMSPRKLKLMANFIADESINHALAQLKFLPKQAKEPLIHLLKSGLATAKDKGLEEDKIYIKSITCDKGPMLKRITYSARGRTNRIKKRMSHLTLILTDKENQKLKIKDPLGLARGGQKHK